MNVYVDQVKTAMRARLIPFGVMLDYQYKNLCVKTSSEALLPVEVEVGKTAMPLEKVAQVGIVDDEHYQIAPIETSYVTPICTAFFKTHPQLKQEVVEPLSSPFVSEETKAKVREMNEDFMQQIGEMPLMPNLIILTTPEVDDNMKKMLLQSVDVLLKQCEVLYKKELTEAKAKVAYALSQLDPLELKNANEELDKEYETHWKSVEDYTEQERQAIEEANKRYHDRHLQEELKEHHGVKAEDESKVFSMKFGEYEE